MLHFGLTILTYRVSIEPMISTFKCFNTETLFIGRRVARFVNIEKEIDHAREIPYPPQEKSC